ncbi:hypothetical protein PIB30_062499 [Stylosanthes scabra]|uniref:Uncharacterized protein n=1 Tax=Stylosanthes scabra TaxID=79078 RepID=A0ABU6UJY7_9FABA|nr:hypothetical protein [Stylosanthes scabra]
MNTFTFPLPDCPQDLRSYRRKAEPFPFTAQPKTPDEVLTLARQCLFYWLHKLILVTHITADPRHFNVEMPYCTVLIIKGPVPEEMMWYIWALSAQYDCAIAVPAFALYHLLCEQQFSGTYLDQLLSIHLHACNNPGLQVITGIEGLSLAEEEASSLQNTARSIQEELSQFQTDFLNSSMVFPTPPLSQDSDPWGGPLSQDPYYYEEEPGTRVYPVLPSPTHVEAGIDDALAKIADDRYFQQSDDDNFAPHMEHDDFADHEPIIK